MFTTTEVRSGNSVIEYREEHISGLRCKISPERINRRLDVAYVPQPQSSPCPFCAGQLERVTPCFPDGTRIRRGESITFPNLFPFAEWHTVTVITASHHVEKFLPAQVRDALLGQMASLSGHDGYPSLNWNYLPSAGASIAHPHLQGLVDRRPSMLAERYLQGGYRYLLRNGRTYWHDLVEGERCSERFLFGDEICWMAQAVPLGEREVRAVFPVSCMADFEPYVEIFVKGLLSILAMYRSLGTHAFNMSLFFDRHPSANGFSAFCSIISRINPNESSISDSAFMERIHQEPVILTLPEELGAYYTKDRK
ncbi:MAG: galactose-1-phosphate uridylyltransferase [Methanolinea sp.]|jgi:galactose-1-phosphate uridylyltransferase|nr:galactose-1-phosphate uridylyltransferase [Methanolinea sp.]